MNVAMEDTDFSTLKDGSQLENNKHKAGTLGAMLGERLQSATDVSSTYFSEVNENSGGDIAPINIEMEVTCTAAAISTADAAAAEEDAPDNIACAGFEAPEADEAPQVDEGIVQFKPNATDYYVFALADGTYFGFNKNAKNCAAKGTADCIGFIDVNGSTNPNTIVQCDDGTGENNVACKVDNANVKDIS